jgi:hypothetical protein
MDEVYTTQELIDILWQERLACVKGERLNLAVGYSGHQVIDRFVDPQAIQKFTAYQDFKATIHRYQQQHQVSGILWHNLTIDSQTLHYPAVHENLIALQGDIQVLQQAKTAVVEFWHRATQGMDFYLSVCHGKDYQQISPFSMVEMVNHSQWATIWKWENVHFKEIILQLGLSAIELVDRPPENLHLATEDIHAVNPGSKPIG